MVKRVMQSLPLAASLLLFAGADSQWGQSVSPAMPADGPAAYTHDMMDFKIARRHLRAQEGLVREPLEPSVFTRPLAGELDPQFNPVLGTYVGQVYSSVVQLDGKVVMGGQFINLNGATRHNIARFNTDGSLDATFTPRFSNAVRTMALQPDGKLIVGGDFTSADGVARKGVARINVDGSLDTSFISAFNTSDFVYSLAIQTDGKILVGGNFGLGVLGGIIRLNSDGTRDQAFTTFASSSVFALALQTDGKILLGGRFTQVNGTSSARIARLNSDGSKDTTFMIGTGANSEVDAVVVQPDGKIVIGGGFTSFNGTARGRVARLNSDGTVDAAFVPGAGADSLVLAITLLSNGKFIIGGQFITYNGTPRIRIALVNSDGSLDPSMNPGTGFTAGTGGSVRTIKTLADGSIAVGGFFTQYNSVNRDIAAVIDVTGILDDFALSVFYQPLIRVSKRQSDDKVIVAGTFNRIAGQSVPGNIARFRTDGTVDPTFSPGTGADGQIYAMHIDGATDKIWIVGSFTTFNGTARNRVARLNANGSLDTSFDPGSGANASVSNVIPTSYGGNDQVYVCGSFSAYNGNSRPRIARLNPDGSLDATFNPPGGLAYIEGIIEMSDGKVVAGGIASSDNALMRLNPNGSIDGTFTPATDFDSEVYAIATQYLPGEDKILIGGTFSTIGGVAHRGIARLNLDGTLDTSFNAIGTAVGDSVEDIIVTYNDKIIIGGVISSLNGVARNNVGRLNGDGILDTGFAAEADGMVFDIDGAYGDQDRTLMIGGDFLSVNSISRTGVARMFVEPGVNYPPFDYDGDGRTDFSVFRPSTGAWYLQQTTAGFRGLQFGAVGDRLTPADYDGDQKTDIAIYRPATGTWYILNSDTNTVTYPVFGVAEDLPAPADYDGDGLADLTVFRPSQGTWYRQNSSNGTFFGLQFGSNGDVPTIGDFDGDFEADIGIWRPSNGDWYNIRSADGSVFGERFGQTGDKIAPADYDGDGKTDIAIFRPSTGLWVVRNSATATYSYSVFGAANDVPISGDYDGDGKADIGVWRPSDGTWYIQRSDNGQFIVFPWGQDGDRPTPGAYGN